MSRRGPKRPRTGNPSVPSAEQAEPHDALQDARVRVSSEFSGPIPPPDLLDGYNQIIPDAAERILAMAEKQQAASISIAKRESLIPVLGQVFAFFLFFLGLAGGLLLAYLGKSMEGLATFMGTILTGIVVFFRATKN